MEDAVGLAVAVLVDGQVAAGRHEVDVADAGAEPRVVGARLVVANGADGEDLGVAGREADGGGARGAVPDRRDHGDALRGRVRDCGPGHRGVDRRVEAHVDDMGAVVDGEDKSCRHLVIVAIARAVENSHRHDRRFRRHPGLRQRVVRRLGNGPGDVRAVAAPVRRGRVDIVVRVVVVVDEVVAGDEGRSVQVRGPPVRAEVLEGNAGVEDGHDGAGPLRDRPRVGDLDQRQVPLVPEVGVVGRRFVREGAGRGESPHAVGRGDRRFGHEQGVAHRATAVGAGADDVEVRHPADDLEAEGLQHPPARCIGAPGLEGEDDVTGLAATTRFRAGGRTHDGDQAHDEHDPEQQPASTVPPHRVLSTSPGHGPPPCCRLPPLRPPGPGAQAGSRGSREGAAGAFALGRSSVHSRPSRSAPAG